VKGIKADAEHEKGREAPKGNSRRRFVAHGTAVRAVIGSEGPGPGTPASGGKKPAGQSGPTHQDSSTTKSKTRWRSGKRLNLFGAQALPVRPKIILRRIVD